MAQHLKLHIGLKFWVNFDALQHIAGIDTSPCFNQNSIRNWFFVLVHHSLHLTTFVYYTLPSIGRVPKYIVDLKKIVSTSA